ncbi:hypothetical protein ACH4ZU_07715 [Streptomyces sp. NPDC020472]|uniref:hypothetical protein n=1 Tax=Streptomyces sp. NPDC020472 TaxID=3365075 RepID=UPI00379191C6
MDRFHTLALTACAAVFVTRFRHDRTDGLAGVLDALPLGMADDALNVVAAGAAGYFVVRLTHVQVAAGS